jgi:hypothetical protein
MSLNAEWGPTFNHSKSLNWACIHDTDKYLNPCPPLLQCYYNEALGDTNNTATCHCGTIGRFSNDHFPDCRHDGPMSWLPKLMGILNVSIIFFIIGWIVWIFFTLKKLEQLAANDITKALALTLLAALFEGTHQFFETFQQFYKDPEFHLVFYGTPGIGQTCLSGMGCCMVLSDLMIPLLWLQIASSGMNKADAERRKKKVAKLVIYSGSFFFVTFLLIVSAFNTGMAGMYSLLWIIVILLSFNVGSRKLRSLLTKPGEEEPKTSKDIKSYVNRLTISICLYVVCIVWFFMTGRQNKESGTNPADWQIAASLIYFSLAQCSLQNTIYIRSTLEKKLARFKKNGNRVTPTTTASGISSASSVSSVES